jgi:hypothetical protein
MAGHRGPHPDDARLFSPKAVPRLRAAARELAWLLGRGYPMAGALELVGSRHQLETRQRMALQRSVCSPAQARARKRRAIARRSVARRSLTIDGFNLIIALEVALSGGLLLEGRDGALRDLAGLRGSYHLVEETDRALTLIGETLAVLRPAEARILLDAPVSNSGRLRGRIADHAAGWSVPVSVELAPGVDGLVASSAVAVTADSGILDRCGAWLNLARHVVDVRISDAWRVRL